MNSNQEFFKKIQESLEAARSTVKLKEKIGSDITDVLSMLSVLTSDAVSFKITANNGMNPGYRSNSKLIHIIKKSTPHIGFTLCGYVIDEANGYPVTIENEVTIFNCDDDISLKSTLTEFITDQENSMKIINLISSDKDIPF